MLPRTPVLPFAPAPHPCKSRTVGCAPSRTGHKKRTHDREKKKATSKKGNNNMKHTDEKEKRKKPHLVLRSRVKWQRRE